MRVRAGRRLVDTYDPILAKYLQKEMRISANYFIYNIILSIMLENLTKTTP
jgi:hypothetical protein